MVEFVFQIQTISKWKKNDMLYLVKVSEISILKYYKYKNFQRREKWSWNFILSLLLTDIDVSYNQSVAGWDLMFLETALFSQKHVENWFYCACISSHYLSRIRNSNTLTKTAFLPYKLNCYKGCMANSWKAGSTPPWEKGSFSSASLVTHQMLR
jgi:hypothetical protein